MKKIMFNDKYGLTQAVLEGRKTMTRRVISEKLLNEAFAFTHYDEATKYLLTKAPYKVGEIVAVAQDYNHIMTEWLNPQNIRRKKFENFKHFSQQKPYGIWDKKPALTNKMFVRAELMPHRIRITDVKLEFLLDISEEDCMKEGIVKIQFRDFPNELYLPYFGCKESDVSYTPKGAFRILIGKICGEGTWLDNPLVFAYSFELVQ